MVVCLQGKRLIIVGAGVAGSIAAFLVRRKLGNANEKIVVYEACRRYKKPCGEAMPAWLLKVVKEHGIPLPKTLYRLRAHVFGVAGACERAIEGVEWVVIDKRSWIEELRRRIKDVIVYQTVNVNSIASNIQNIVFDARGPFVGDKPLLVWQSYVECYHSNNVMLNITIKPFGLVWVFPRGKSTCNVGGGFVGIREARKLREKAMNELKKIVDIQTLISESYSIIRVPPSSISIFHGSNIIRLGEAAGLIMSLGGEGIRSAILSAVAAASAISFKNEIIYFNKFYYGWKVRNLMLQSWLQKKLFKTIAELTIEKMCKLLNSIGESTMRTWLEGKLGFWKTLSEIPHILFSLF